MFKSNKITKDKVWHIAAIQEKLANLTAICLSEILYTPVLIKTTSIKKMPYKRYIHSISQGVTLASISTEPINEKGIIAIDTGLYYEIIDRICGGTGRKTKIRYGHTEIETSLLEGITVRMLGNLREAFCPTIDLRPRLLDIYTSPALNGK